MFKRITLIAVLLVILFTVTGSALAQDYYFRLDRNYVDAYWNADGTLALYYQMTFYNDPIGHAIEYVDLGLPNNNYDFYSISADVDGVSVAYISESEYEGSGTGVAVALGNASIPPGQTGTVNIWVGEIRDVLYVDDNDETYASAVFVPTWFGSQYVYGTTDLQVTYHLPPGVQPAEPRWHAAPEGFPAQPITGRDRDGRITYIWRNPNANGYSQYKFGASFPAKYVPAGTVSKPTFFTRHNIHINWEAISNFLCFGGVALIFIFSTIYGQIRARKRRMKYLPPKIRIEGHGIKRGLTAVEAAVLMEQPPDKVLTMILFSVVKKGAARVVSRDPLKLEVADPPPENLRAYETRFLKAFQEKNAKKRRKELQDLMIWLIRSVSKKMKGFSHKETVAYYKKIMEKAWQQVENADTPEIKSEEFDKHMGWTMLDEDFDQRTEEVFRSGPVYVPMWWGRYDPTWSSGPKTMPKPSASGGGRGVSMPTLPGGAFAASMVTGIQDFAGDVVGNVTDFTSTITNKTNPVSSSSGGWSSGGGSSCACACACAGCACACAGGGR